MTRACWTSDEDEAVDLYNVVLHIGLQSVYCCERCALRREQLSVAKPMIGGETGGCGQCGIMMGRRVHHLRFICGER